MMQGTRLAPVRRRLAYGPVIKRDPRGAPLAEWVRPYLTDRGVRRDTIKVLKGIDPAYTLDAAEKLRSWDKPAMLAWAVEDRFFNISFGERLAATIQGATLERVEDSYTFVSEDQPERLAELVEAFITDAAPAGA
jgi:pimeloyl-ACP methyl ester carboxylesterase